MNALNNELLKNIITSLETLIPNLTKIYDATYKVNVKLADKLKLYIEKFKKTKDNITYDLNNQKGGANNDDKKHMLFVSIMAAMNAAKTVVNKINEIINSKIMSNIKTSVIIISVIILSPLLISALLLYLAIISYEEYTLQRRRNK
jgi:small-conductance mechanosensitive channel